MLDESHGNPDAGTAKRCNFPAKQRAVMRNMDMPHGAQGQFLIVDSEIPGLFAAPEWRWRRSDVALPDRPIVELNQHTVRGIDGALVPALDPYPGGRREPVGLRAGRLTGFIQEIEIRSILGDEGRTAHQTLPAHLDALVGTGQIDGLRRRPGDSDGGQHAHGQ
jgi:hypothetical protein